MEDTSERMLGLRGNQEVYSVLLTRDQCRALEIAQALEAQVRGGSELAVTISMRARSRRKKPEHRAPPATDVRASNSDEDASLTKLSVTSSGCMSIAVISSPTKLKLLSTVDAIAETTADPAISTMSQSRTLASCLGRVGLAPHHPCPCQAKAGGS